MMHKNKKKHKDKRKQESRSGTHVLKCCIKMDEKSLTSSYYIKNIKYLYKMQAKNLEELYTICQNPPKFLHQVGC